ncbi:MAG TPA: SRPBCC family protein [Gaiellaceae bacterium]|nr:SRPBCC family protein [Gaiellaceae bacterium]
MHRNEHTVEIAAAPEEVFPYLVDGERRLEWMGVLQESEKLTDGPPGVGSRWRDVFEDHGHRIELDAELEEYEPGRRLVVRLRNRAFESTSTQVLEEAAGGTRLTAVIETEYKALAARLMAGVVTRHAQKQLEADLTRLKAIVERG